MVDKICKFPDKHSFFLFGARGTGKTTLIHKQFDMATSSRSDGLFIDLLVPDQEEIYSSHPNLLREQLTIDPHRIKRVVLDAIQKVPKLLDVVHFCMEKFKSIQFILTGSSARKLKYGGGNLLGWCALKTLFNVPNKVRS